VQKTNNNKLKTLNPNCVHTTSTLVHFLRSTSFLFTTQLEKKSPSHPQEKKGGPFIS
jgi:hypothetical protein